MIAAATTRVPRWTSARQASMPEQVAPNGRVTESL